MMTYCTCGGFSLRLHPHREVHLRQLSCSTSESFCCMQLESFFVYHHTGS